MKIFRDAPERCAQHHGGVETAGTELVERGMEAPQRISKWLIFKCNLKLVKVSPRRRGACGNAHWNASSPQPSTALSTRIVDKREILTLSATCTALLGHLATIARKPESRARGMQA